MWAPFRLGSIVNCVLRFSPSVLCERSTQPKIRCAIAHIWGFGWFGRTDHHPWMARWSWLVFLHWIYWSSFRSISNESQRTHQGICLPWQPPLGSLILTTLGLHRRYSRSHKNIFTRPFVGHWCEAEDFSVLPTPRCFKPNCVDFRKAFQSRRLCAYRFQLIV